MAEPRQDVPLLGQLGQMTLLEFAIQTAVLAHAGQIDEDGLPHVIHCMSVSSAVQIEFEKSPIPGYTLEELLIAAILHDSVEDSDGKVTLDQIRELWGGKICDIVDALTRREGEFYRDFIYRVQENPGACLIKIADLLHNMGRTHKISPKKAKWREKLEYKYAI